jgi:hypothetical protein
LICRLATVNKADANDIRYIFGTLGQILKSKIQDSKVVSSFNDEINFEVKVTAVEISFAQCFARHQN